MRGNALRTTRIVAAAVVLGGAGLALAGPVPPVRAAAPATDVGASSDGVLRGVVRSLGAATAGRAHRRWGPVHARPLLGPSGRAISPPRRPIPAVSTPDASAASVTPRTPVTVGAGFDALRNARPATAPSDSTGALGDSWYMTAVNVSTAVFDRAGVRRTPPIRLRTLGDVLPRGAFDFDPKVVYDQYDDHFVLAFLALDSATRFRKSWIVLATVADAVADDPGRWCVTRIAGDQYKRDGRQWADYPGIGYDADRVTISTNQFDFPRGAAGTQIVSFPKADLYDCDAGLSGKVFGGRRTRNPDGSRSFTLQPAQTVGGVAPDVQYLVEFEYDRRTGRKLVVFRIQRTSSGLDLSKAQRRVRPARMAFLGTQRARRASPDTLWDVGDLRLVNAQYDADLDRLYTAHTVRKNVPPSRYIESATRWYEVRPAGKLSRSRVTRDGVLGTSLRDYGWPVVATDAGGNAYVTYSRAGAPGPGEYLSAWVAEVRPSGAVSETLLKAGEGTYDAAPGPERWGDYNAIGRDPSNGARVATVNQYAVDDGGGGATARWRQWVNLVTHG